MTDTIRLMPLGARLHGSGVVNVDSKFRVVIRANLRERLGNPAIITRGAGCALLLFPWDTWLQVVDDCYALPGFGTFYTSGAEEVDFQQEKGRVVIPYVLREHANLRRGVSVTVAGIGRAVVIARTEAWDRKVREAEEELFGR